MPTRSDWPEATPRSSGRLRQELSARNLARATAHVHETTYGEVASVLFREESDGLHGNFLPASYRRMRANPAWAKRLDKTYSASRRIVRGGERARSELDCSNSSDALLMNVFCHPQTLRSAGACALLGVERGVQPVFGLRVRTPLRAGLEDRTEVDMQLGDLLIEAKLTEADFQTGAPALMQRYEHFETLFDTERLPRCSSGHFRGYQLLRGVLAGHHHGMRFAVLCDGRRHDLREQFFAVLSAVRAAEVRARMLLLTWQEVSATLPRTVQAFLAAKYGIAAR